MGWNAEWITSLTDRSHQLFIKSFIIFVVPRSGHSASYTNIFHIAHCTLQLQQITFQFCAHLAFAQRTNIMSVSASVQCLKNNRYNLCTKSKKYKNRETVQCLMFLCFALNMCITFSRGFNRIMNILLMGTSAVLVLKS